MKHTINVELKHIEHGEMGDINTCPIALAVNEQLDGICTVGRYHINLRQRGGGVLTGYLTGEAVTFIQHFDSRAPVLPFSFEIELNPI